MDNKNYNIMYDVFRIIACVMIFCAHFVDIIGMSGTIATAIQSGASTLTFFFMLSGYFAYDSLARTGNVRKWYKKRFLRTLPTYWMSLIFVLICVIFVEEKTVHLTELSFWGSFCMALVGLNLYIPGDWNNPGIIWAMSVFIVFYVIAPLVYRYVNTFRRALIMVALSYILQFVLLHTGSNLGCGIFADFYIFALGIAIWEAFQENKSTLLLQILSILLFVWVMMGREGGFSFTLSCAVLLVLFNSVDIENQQLTGIIKKMAKLSMDFWLGHGVAFRYVESVENGANKAVLAIVLTGLFTCVLYCVESLFTRKIVKQVKEGKLI